MTSTAVCLFCRKLLMHQSIMSSVDIQVMRLTILCMLPWWCLPTFPEMMQCWVCWFFSSIAVFRVLPWPPLTFCFNLKRAHYLQYNTSNKPQVWKWRRTIYNPNSNMNYFIYTSHQTFSTLITINYLQCTVCYME